MLTEAPPFWWRRPDWRAAALSPLSAAYSAAARRRLVNAPREKVELPVLCVGNFTVGGSGKTPVAIALARQASAMRLKPGFLSRGHGGNSTTPRIVDVVLEDARHVGDEPLLLAAHAPVAISANRAAGARLLAAAGLRFRYHGRRLPERPHPYGLRLAGGGCPPWRRQWLGAAVRAAARQSGGPAALCRRRLEDGRGHGRRHDRPPGVACRKAGFPGVRAAARSRAFRRAALSGFRRHRPPGQVLRDAAAGPAPRLSWRGHFRTITSIRRRKSAT